MPFNDFGYSLHETGWRVTLPSWWKRSSINLLQLGKVNRVFEARFNRQPVRSPSICRDLRTPSPRGSGAHVAHERNRVRCRALASKPRENQLGIGVHRKERVLLPNFGAFFDRDTALSLLNEAVQLVALDALDSQILKFVPHHLGGALRRDEKQSHDCVAVESSQALCRTDRAAFDKTFESERGHFGMRCDGVPRQLVVGFTESGFAGLAAPALNAALTEVTKLLAGLVLASNTCHDFSPLDCWREKSQTQFGSGLRLTPRFGLSPALPVSAGSGALSVNYDLGWRFDRDLYGLTGSECDLDSDDHAVFILPESPVAAGLSYLASNSGRDRNGIRPLAEFERPPRFRANDLALLPQSLQNGVEESQGILYPHKVVAPSSESVSDLNGAQRYATGLSHHGAHKIGPCGLCLNLLPERITKAYFGRLQLRDLRVQATSFTDFVRHLQSNFG